MGYNTTVLFLNDGVHLLEKDKEFPKKLYMAICQSSPGMKQSIDVSLLGHVNAVQVLGTEHADSMRIYTIGGNQGSLLGAGSCYNSEHRLLRKLAEDHGFALVRPRLEPGETVAAKYYNCDDCKQNRVYGSCYDCRSALDENGICEKRCGGRR